MQNRTFLVLLRPIFAQKMKTAPPKRFGNRSSKVVAAIRPEEPLEFVISAEKSVSVSVKTFFFSGDHLFLEGKSATISDFGGKILLNFGEDFFFGDHLFWGEKPPQSDSRAMKIWVKVAYSCLNLLKKPPPPLYEILVTRLRRRP